MIPCRASSATAGHGCASQRRQPPQRRTLLLPLDLPYSERVHLDRPLPSRHHPALAHLLQVPGPHRALSGLGHPRPSAGLFPLQLRRSGPDPADERRDSNGHLGYLVSLSRPHPRLREFLVQEHLDGDVDERILRKLFGGLPLLRALDFCACSSTAFWTAFTRLFDPAVPFRPTTSFQLERLSLHECGTLPPSVFEALLPRLPRLTHLDLGHTSVSGSALLRLPRTARLTHLNLSRCTRITGQAVVAFVTTHPAARDSLVYLNLLADPSRYRLLNEADVTQLLPNLPPTLRALNLNGAKVNSRHIPLLRPLTAHLEELGLAYAELSLADIQSFYHPPAPSVATVDDEDAMDHVTSDEAIWHPPSLRYLDVTGVTAATPSTLLSTSCALLRPSAYPLDVLELSPKAVTGLRERTSKGRSGWVVREFGRRAWYVRTRPEDSSTEDDRRSWKMGSLWWGMRKIPVARSEVGGLYGHYMFKQ